MRSIRIVRTPERTGRCRPHRTRQRRGAYLHPVRACWEKALKGGTIRHALKIVPAPDDVEALRAFARALPAEESDTI